MRSSSQTQAVTVLNPQLTQSYFSRKQLHLGGARDNQERNITYGFLVLEGAESPQCVPREQDEKPPPRSPEPHTPGRTPGG